MGFVVSHAPPGQERAGIFGAHEDFDHSHPGVCRQVVHANLQPFGVGEDLHVHEADHGGIHHPEPDVAGLRDPTVLGEPYHLGAHGAAGLGRCRIPGAIIHHDHSPGPQGLPGQGADRTIDGRRIFVVAGNDEIDGRGGRIGALALGLRFGSASIGLHIGAKGGVAITSLEG